MTWKETRRISDRIERLINKAKTIGDDELKADLARYICVLASGYLEASCREVFGNFAQEQSSPSVHRFVIRHLDRYSNLNTEKFLQLVESFTPECREKLEIDKEFEKLKDAVDSIVANRNNIAHGRDTGISLVTIESYYKRAKRFIALIGTSLFSSS